MGLAVGVEKLAGAGLLGAGGAPEGRQERVDAAGPLRRGHQHRRPHRHRHACPACSPRSGMEYGHKYGGTSFELFARISREEPRALTLNPLAAYTKKMTLERDHERRDDRLPEHAADVLGQLRRRGGGGGGERREAEDAVARAAAPGHQGVGIGAHHRPVAKRPARCCPTSTRSPATRRSRRTSRPASAPRTSTSSSCTTASPPPSWCTTTTSCCARRAARPTSSSRGATWRDGTTPVNVSGGLESQGPPDRGHRHRQHLGGLPPPARRGRRPSDRGREGGPGPRHRPRLGLRRAHPGGLGALSPAPHSCGQVSSK